MKTIDGLIQEFDLNNCEDMTSIVARQMLRNAYVMGMSAGISLIMSAFKESQNQEDSGFNYARLAPRLASLLAQMEETAKKLQQKS